MEDKKPISNRQKPILVAIAGPTASGKTGVAVKLAKALNTEILSFDSRQCYREMQTGTAKPTAAEQAGIPHHFIDSHSIDQRVDAALFAGYGLQVLEKLFEKYPVVVAVGGTGLYLKALTEGLDSIPDIPENIRDQARNLHKEEGLEGVQKQLSALDPAFADTGEWKNPQRLMRSLEVIWHTGYPIRHFQQQSKAERPFETLLFGLDVPRTILVERIDKRVDEMMKAGLMEEVKSLYPKRHLNALQTVGYQEIFDFLDQKCTLEAAGELIKIHTRQYAKRQVTWFKKQPGIHWVAPSAWQEILDWTNQRLLHTKTG